MKYRKAVFIVVYSRTKNKIEYLILKRKLHWKGWEFPKGGRERFERKRKSVKRELFEETGLKPKNIKKFSYKGHYDYKKNLPDHPKMKGQTFQLFAVEVKKGGVKLDKKEHCDYKWVSYSEAINWLKWSNQKKSLEIVNKWLTKA